MLQDIKYRKDQDLLVLPTDAALFDDEAFRVINQDQFLNCEDPGSIH
jgi:hypothetical protein